MNVELELLTHPKYRALRRRVGPEALEYLLRLWGHCATNKRGQDWPNADSAYVEDVCDWTGTPGELFKHLVEIRFVDAAPRGLVIHDWNEQNSFTVANWNRNPHGRNGRPTAQPRAHTPTPTSAQTHDKPMDNPRVDHGEPLRVNRVSEESEESEGATALPPTEPEKPDPKPEADPPPHIPSLQEFQAAFGPDGIPPEYLAAKFAWFEGQNAWLNRHGQLKNWRVLVRSWWSTDRANWRPPSDPQSSQRAGAAPEGVWAIQKKIDALAEAIRLHAANIVGSAPVAQPTEEQVAELKKLRADLKQLKTKLLQ